MTVAERDVPSGLAALLIASVPLWVVLLRSTVGGERVTAGRSPASRSASWAWRCCCSPAAGRRSVAVGGCCSCCRGVLVGHRLVPLAASTCRRPARVDRLADGRRRRARCWPARGVGRAGDLHLGSASTKSLLAFAYLVIGSLVAFTAYTWLLQNAPISKVSTYAYVNPVVAVLLGWALLSEQISVVTLVGAALIVASVAVIVRREAAAEPEPEPARAELADDPLHHATRCRRLSFVIQPTTRQRP